MINYQSLPGAHQARINAVIAAKGGKSQAARIFGCARQTLKNAAAGLPVHPWIVTSLAQKIAERDAAGKNP